jgi:hypothetical protein
MHDVVQLAGHGIFGADKEGEDLFEGVGEDLGLIWQLA